METIKVDEPQVNKQFDIQKIKITNVDKVFWEHENITKGDVIDYYNEMSEYILPYIIDRDPNLYTEHQTALLKKVFFKRM